MVRLAGLSLVLFAGCLDLNPVFVEPTSTGGSDSDSGETTGSPPTTAGPTTTPPTGSDPGTDSVAATDPTNDPTIDPTTESPDTQGSTTMPPGYCGDGVVNPGEGCDDGNDDPADACLPDCVMASCGDGALWLGKEECDDGNMVDDDECLNVCTSATCGDGVKHKDKEECDDGNMDDSDGCVACKPAMCGDGKLQEGVEECDDGNNVGDDGCEPMSCLKTAKVVFVTSEVYTGKLGGVMGAHALCLMHAMKANLPMAPYLAWISDDKAYPALFMTKSQYPYVNTKKEIVAPNWQGLVSGNLMATVGYDENGQPAPMVADSPCSQYPAHTNTTAGGTIANMMSHCGGWNSLTGATIWGDTLATNGKWTDDCAMGVCQMKAPIYCVQQ